MKSRQANKTCRTHRMARFIHKIINHPFIQTEKEKMDFEPYPCSIPVRNLERELEATCSTFFEVNQLIMLENCCIYYCRCFLLAVREFWIVLGESKIARSLKKNWFNIQAKVVFILFFVHKESLGRAKHMCIDLPMGSNNINRKMKPKKYIYQRKYYSFHKN